MLFTELAAFLKNYSSITDLSKTDAKLTEQLQTPVWDIFKHGMARIEDIFETCYIQGEPYDCQEVLNYTKTDLNLCYSFNPKIVSIDTTLHIPGPDYGISFHIDTRPNDYLLSASSGIGLTVLAHDPILTWPLMQQRALALAPGFEYFLAIQRKETQRMSKPYDVKCVSDATYSYEKCLGTCHIETLFSRCNCSLHENDQFNTSRLCRLYDLLTCFQSSPNTPSSNCQCQPSCKAVNFQTTLTAMKLPRQSFFSTLNILRNDFEDNIKSSKMNLRIFYESMEVIVTEQRASMEWRQLLAEIGGLLGLFLGASVITLVEFGEIIWTLIYKSCKTKSINKQHNELQAMSYV